MKKGLLLIIMLLALLLLAGCNLVGYDEELDNAQIVATVGDTEITKAQWLNYRDSLANYYEQYYAANLGISLPMTDETLEAYGEDAIEAMIEAVVVQDKMVEMGLDPLDEEHAAEVEEYADSMMDLYKQLIRYQNYPDVETVEEEQARLAEEAEGVEDAEPAGETEGVEDAEPADETEGVEDAEPAGETEGVEDAEPAGETENVEDAEPAGETEGVEDAEPAGETENVEDAEPADETEGGEGTEPVATITDAELDAMLEADLAEMGYTREYFVQMRTSEVQSDLLREEVVKDVAVSDEEVKTEFDTRVSNQQTSYDATPTLYASAVNNGSDVYYTPAGYRGVKNLLIGLNDEDQSAIDELNSTLTTATSTQTSVQGQLDDLAAEDTSEYDEEALAAYNEQVEALTAQLEEATATIETTQTELDAKTEAAFAAILPKAQETLERIKAGENFDTVMAEVGEDPGMNSEPAKTRGYLICDGLTLYVTEFQDAAMALAQPGDVSDLVRTSYGYHILKYETDIEPGVCEYTDEIVEDIRSELLATAQDAAYEAAVSQWVSEADVKTYPKVMK